MKSVYSILVYASFLCIILVVSLVPCNASEQQDTTTHSKDVLKPQGKRLELPPERVDRIIERLKKTDPKKAEELQKLRTENPAEFQTELGKVMRQEYLRKIAPRKIRDMEPKSERGAKSRVWLDNSGRKHNDFLEWLKENCPEDAKRLSELKGKQPEVYKEQFDLSLKKYGRIARISKNNPQLAQILKEELELEEQIDKLLEKVKAEGDAGQKEKLTKELEEMAGRKVDLTVKKKRIKHEQLLERLKELQEKVKQNETELKKWDDPAFKSDKIKALMKDLVNTGQN